AQGHNAGTVLVEHQGEIEADANGIHVQNIHGSVTVDQSGTITAGDVGIYTSAAGASRTLVEKAGTILAYSHGIHSIANAGVIDINVYYGDIRSTAGHGILATKISDGGSTSVNVQGDVTAALDGIRTRAINSATDVTLS